MKQKLALFFLTAWALSAPVFGGQLTLSNGDRLEGDFVRLEGGKLVWNSPVFGEIQVETSRVVSVRTNLAVKLDGHEAPCYWLSVEEGVVQFECEDGDNGTVDVMALNLVLPHEQYANGHYNYNGKLTLSGRRASGNKEEQIWTVNNETHFRRGDFRHETRLHFDSISQYKLPTQSRGRARYSLDWFFEEQWFWYNNVRLSFDEPAKIKESYVYGTGLGYQVWETPRSALSLETGLDFVKEHFESPESPTADFEAKNQTAAWRWALDVRYRLPRNAALFHRHQLSRSLERSKDWKLETEIGLTMPLAGRLYSEIRLDYDVDNFPVEGNRREDKQLIIGVGYSW